MSDIRISINQLPEPSKSIGEILIEFYETMKKLDYSEHPEGMRATKIVMTISDIEKIMESELATVLQQLWQGDMGKQKWIDVPTVVEGE